MKVTIFKSLKDTTAALTRDVYLALDRIKEGKSRELVEQIRKLDPSNVEKIGTLKKALSGVCFSGSFKHRSKAGLISHSGLVTLDIDKLSTIEDATILRDSIASDDYVFSTWVSPSGRGIKVLVKIPASEKTHKDYFESIKAYFIKKEYCTSEQWDDSGSDVSRFCFESYDPDIYINPASLPFLELIEPDIEEVEYITVKVPLTSESLIIDRLMKWWEKKYGMNEGSRNANLFKLAKAFCDYGIPLDVALSKFQMFSEKDFNTSEIKTTTESAYKNRSNFGTKFFEDHDKHEKIEKLIRAGKTQKEIVKSIDGSDDFVESIRENLNIDEFYYYDEKGKIKLDPWDFRYWLEQHGFYRHHAKGNTGAYKFVHINENIVGETIEDDIKTYVLKFLTDKPDIGKAPYNFMSSSTGYFKKDFLNQISSIDLKIKRDTKESCFLYFQNCMLEITKNGTKEVDYVDAEAFVWKDQVIQKNYKKVDHHAAEYRKFIWLLSGEDGSRYDTLKSVIGYLMHTYKTSSNNRAIIFNDASVSENPEGGSGKGIFWNAFKHIKNVARVDGKLYDPKKSFAFQSVKLDTQILVFDDVKKNFKFEDLFSIITEGIEIEYKNQGAVMLPVEDSPKIIITSNYTLEGKGGSFERRMFEVELSSFFHAKNTPKMIFGHDLFTDWDEEEWMRFYNYMIECEIYYLKNGLVRNDFYNLKVRKFIKSTSQEFYEWSKEKESLIPNTRLYKGELFNTFINEYPDFKKFLSQKKFTGWMVDYSRYYEKQLIQSRDHIGLYYEVIDTNYEKPEDEVPF